MKTLIAIGGGSFQKQETMSIDTYAISRCGKTQPHVLFIPLAGRDDQGYAKRFKQYYRSLGCQVEALRLLHTKLSNEEIYKKFRSQDMIYLGAGDTVFLMEQLKQRKLDLLLKELSQQGIVICGISAGANALFEYGYSNIASDTFELVNGMGMIEGAFCPHYQKEERKSFDMVCRKQNLPAIGCADQCAYVVTDEKRFFLE